MEVNIDLTNQINESFGSEEEVSQEAWAEEKKTGKKLNKPFRTSKGPKKFSVYVKNEKGNVVKVNFGDPNMEIKRDDPARRKSFRARHNCVNPDQKQKLVIGHANSGVQAQKSKGLDMKEKKSYFGT